MLQGFDVLKQEKITGEPNEKIMEQEFRDQTQKCIECMFKKYKREYWCVRKINLKDIWKYSWKGYEVVAIKYQFASVDKKDKCYYNLCDTQILTYNKWLGMFKADKKRWWKYPDVIANVFLADYYEFNFQDFDIVIDTFIAMKK